MTLTSKERAELRAEAHHLSPTVHVGVQGLTPQVLQSLDDALRTHELVKVQLGRNPDHPAKEAAGVIAERTGSDVVQVIGKTATLYRLNPDIPRKKGALPPWRR